LSGSSDILEIVNSRARELNLPFLVIGGHAVIAHGYPRFTKDLDLLVRRTDRDQWLDLLNRLGFELWQDGGVFLQFKTEQSEVWPVDLMLVNDQTFAKLSETSCEKSFAKTSARVPSVEHLLALKVHALKSVPEHRVLRDLDDVLRLVELHKIDVSAPGFRDIFVRYGNMEIYERIARAFRQK
jgi:hypothetical protein